MLTSFSILALAAASIISATPLKKRQETASSVASTAISSAASEPASAVSSGASEASSGAAAATSAASSAASSASSAAPSTTGTNNSNSYPAYPCPSGYLLTYVTYNMTIPVPVTNVTGAIGNWANSTIFPNITQSKGENEVGASHTLDIPPVKFQEALVEVHLNETSGAARWVWNNTGEPLSAEGLTITNYSTVLSVYNPAYTTTGKDGNETIALGYSNFCTNDQEEGSEAIKYVLRLELTNIHHVSLGEKALNWIPYEDPEESPESSIAPESATSAAEATATGAASSAGSSVSSAVESVTTSAAAGASSAATPSS